MCYWCTSLKLVQILRHNQKHIKPKSYLYFMKNFIFIVLLFFSVNTFAQQKEKTYKLLASCGTCNFDMPSETGCALAVQIAGKHYWVDGSTLQDHGDEHDPEGGMCNHIKKAEATGYIEDGRLRVSNFTIIDKKKQKRKKK